MSHDSPLVEPLSAYVDALGQGRAEFDLLVNDPLHRRRLDLPPGLSGPDIEQHARSAQYKHYRAEYVEELTFPSDDDLWQARTRLRFLAATAIAAIHDRRYRGDEAGPVTDRHIATVCAAADQRIMRKKQKHGAAALGVREANAFVGEVQAAIEGILDYRIMMSTNRIG